MRTLLVVLTFISMVGSSYSQVTSKDMIGLWATCNVDSIYYIADTLTLYQDINRRTHLVNPCCYEINWDISSSKKLIVKNLLACTEPGRIQTINGKETFKLSKGIHQILTIKRSGKVIERFKLLKFEVQSVDRFPHEIKMMKLKRLQ